MSAPASQGLLHRLLGRDLRHLLGNSAWLFGARVAALPLGLAQAVLTARLLGVEAYGVLAIVLTFVATLNQLTSFRMNEFLVKHLSDALASGRRERAAATVKVALLAEAAASLLSFALLWATAGLAARWFVGDPAAAALVRLYAFFVLGNVVFESSSGILQVFDRFRVQAGALLAIKVLTLAGVAATWLAGGGLREVVLALTLGTALPALAAGLLAVREVGRRLGAGWWQASLAALAGSGARMRRFAISTHASSTLSIVVKDADALWLGWLSSPTEVGYYKLASTLVKLVFLPGNPLVQAAYPQIAAAIARGETARTRALLWRSSAAAAAWIVPGAILLALAAPWALPAFFGAQFAPATPALAPLLAGIGLAQVFFWTRPTLLALGRADVALGVAALNTLLKVALVLLLVPATGALGMAGITAALFVLGAALSALFVARALRAGPRPDAAPAAMAVEGEPLASEAE